MNKKLDEGLSFSDDLKQNIKSSNSEAIVILGVPFTHLERMVHTSDALYAVSAQDCSAKESGAFTGEISSSMIASTGAQYVILGHSERRAYHAENNTDLAAKVDRCLFDGLTVIYCCGEQLEERESNSHFELVKRQLSEALFHLSSEQMASVVIAYEPVWAIGTGKTATPEQAQEVHRLLRGYIAGLSEDIAANLQILYGGSVKDSNAGALFTQADIDGGLVGGASLQAEQFIAICANTEN